MLILRYDRVTTPATEVNKDVPLSIKALAPPVTNFNDVSEVTIGTFISLLIFNNPVLTSPYKNGVAAEGEYTINLLESVFVVVIAGFDPRKIQLFPVLLYPVLYPIATTLFPVLLYPAVYPIATTFEALFWYAA